VAKDGGIPNESMVVPLEAWTPQVFIGQNPSLGKHKFNK
jgi:hypothetical protein